MTKQLETVAVPDHILVEASRLIDWLNQTVEGLHLPRTDRARAAATCFAVAHDHHEAIVMLSGNKYFASSFALVRIAFDAYVRGVWLSICATDAEVANFVALKEPPNLGMLILAIEQHPDFEGNSLSKYKKEAYKWMCDFTHTGGRQVERWNGESIAANYSLKEVLEVLAISESIALLALLGLIALVEDREAALAAIREFEPARDRVLNSHERQRNYQSQFS